MLINRTISYSIILLTFIIYSFAAAATEPPEFSGSLQGFIRDASSGHPLEGADIAIPDLKTGTVSDSNGHFVFDNLPNGTFTIQVTYSGYKSKVESVTIRSNTTRDFLMSPSIIENENVTVTGVASAIDVKKSPLQISVLSKKDLIRSSGTNLMDVVARQPGVSVVTTGPAVAKPFIRGLGYNRVVTVNDGVRQEGQQWGDEHGIEVDEYSAQKVEVLRGPASLMYGSDAIGGVINILTNVSVPNNTLRANLSGSMNSNNQMYGGYGNIAGNVNGFNWNAYGSLKTAADYRNKYDGQVLNSRFKEQNLGGYLGLNKRWGYSHLIFSSFDQHPGMVDGERDDQGNFILNGYNMTDALRDSREPLVPKQWVLHRKVALDNSFSLNAGGRITVLAALQNNKRREFANPENPQEVGSYFDLNTFNYSAAYHLPTVAGWKTSFGINGMSQTNTNRGKEALIPDYRLFDVGGFGVSSKSFKNTTVSGGLRYDVRNLNSKATMEDQSLKFEAFQKQFSNFSASLGLSHVLSKDVTVKANLSRGFRAPNIPELAANGEHEGTGRYEIGNRGLKSETSFSADAGFELATDHVDFSFSPYYNHINNYVYYERILNAAGADSLIAGVPAFRFSQQSAKLAGLEARLDLHPHPLDWLHFENTFSFVRGKFTERVDGSGNLPLISPARLLTELRAEFANQGKTFRNLYLKLEMDNITRQGNYFGGYNTETATAGYTLFHAGAGTDIFMGGTRRASLVATVNNLTDVAYQDHLSRFKYFPENSANGRRGVFNMGRSFNLRLLVPFEWRLK